MAEACVCPPRTGPAPDTLAGIIRRFCEPCLRHLVLLRPLTRVSGAHGPGPAGRRALAAVGTAAAAELERRERLRRAHWAEETGL